MLSDTPPYDKLRTMRAMFEQGLAAANQRGAMECATIYRGCLEDVEARIEALNQPIYPHKRTDDMKALARAYKAKEVTPREFATRMRRLLYAHSSDR